MDLYYEPIFNFSPTIDFGAKQKKRSFFIFKQNPKSHHAIRQIPSRVLPHYFESNASNVSNAQDSSCFAYSHFSQFFSFRVSYAYHDVVWISANQNKELLIHLPTQFYDVNIMLTLSFYFI